MHRLDGSWLFNLFIFLDNWLLILLKIFHVMLLLPISIQYSFLPWLGLFYLFILYHCLLLLKQTLPLRFSNSLNVQKLLLTLSIWSFSILGNCEYNGILCLLFISIKFRIWFRWYLLISSKDLFLITSLWMNYSCRIFNLHIFNFSLALLFCWFCISTKSLHGFRI